MDYIQTRGCAVSSSTDAPVRQLQIQNLPLPTTSSDLKKIFPDVDFIEEPKMLDWGASLVTVYEKDVRRCLLKNNSDFRGQSIHVKLVSNHVPPPSASSSVLRVHCIPYHWHTKQVKEFLTKHSPVFRLVVLTPSVIGNESNGTIFVVYHDVRSRDIAKDLLNGMKITDDKTGIERTLFTTESDVIKMRNTQIWALRRKGKSQHNLTADM